MTDQRSPRTDLGILRKPRLSLSRDETYSLIEGLEAYFDSFAPNDDYLIEREIALHERLQTWARKKDKERGYRW